MVRDREGQLFFQATLESSGKFRWKTQIDVAEWHLAENSYDTNGPPH